MPNEPAIAMPALKKANLPQKICLTCGRPYVWRKKWAAVWTEVKHCSTRCRRNRRSHA
ncbi:MAG: DUF2256 domain-containing protein [Azonexus sp.]|nr:DUF2256 domain-containing protein [Azonexus sp.]